MNANAEVLCSSELIGLAARETVLPRVRAGHEPNNWNPEDFAREQIRGLVRRVFFTTGATAVKQVVFSAVEAHTDVFTICDQVGQALALETTADVAILGREPQTGGGVPAHRQPLEGALVKGRSTRVAANLWRVPEFGLGECGEESGTGRYWFSCLAQLRREFEYSIIHGPVAGISSEAALLGQLADGIILVLGAHSTRRATARKIKEGLEAGQSRILGTVLSGRRFPVPERIYRRL